MTPAQPAALGISANNAKIIGESVKEET